MQGDLGLESPLEFCQRSQLNPPVYQQEVDWLVQRFVLFFCKKNGQKKKPKTKKYIYIKGKVKACHNRRALYLC